MSVTTSETRLKSPRGGCTCGTGNRSVGWGIGSLTYHSTCCQCQARHNPFSVRHGQHAMPRLTNTSTPAAALGPSNLPLDSSFNMHGIQESNRSPAQPLTQITPTGLRHRLRPCADDLPSQHAMPKVKQPNATKGITTASTVVVVRRLRLLLDAGVVAFTWSLLGLGGWDSGAQFSDARYDLRKPSAPSACMTARIAASACCIAASKACCMACWASATCAPSSCAVTGEAMAPSTAAILTLARKL